MYYKHQKCNHTVSFIAGDSSKSHAFIQVITNRDSYYFNYSSPVTVIDDTVLIGGSVFSNDGIKIKIEEKGVSIGGWIKYARLTPIRYDIMGPFKYLPMQCKHKIVSLHHRLEGRLCINGETFDFTGGIGYMEGDFGVSFPKSYVWIQCNDFPKKVCIMASVADIPFAGFHFRGCICIIYLRETEYRLATYLGARILVCNENKIIIEQGKLRLEVEIEAGAGHKLLAPEKGAMSREIRERIVCGARFRFVRGGEVLFAQASENASFEYVN